MTLRYLALLAIGVAACGNVTDRTGSNATTTTTSTTTCPTDSTLTYENFGQALIANYCLACHDGDERPTLTTQAAVKANARAIRTQAVTSTRMPQRSSMPAGDRTKLGEWLSCGAP